MGETLTTEAPPPTVAQAREMLRDVSRLAPQRQDEAERVIAAWLASRPRGQSCCACSSMVWAEREKKDGQPAWCCVGCGRPASLTQEEWHSQQAAAREKAAEARVAAVAPPPRSVLDDALERRAEATEALTKLESALPGAREAITVALSRHNAAQAAVTAAEQGAVARLASNLIGEPAAAVGVTSGAARGQLRAAQDALDAARAAKGLIEDRSHFAKQNLVTATAQARSAALSVLADEALEPLIEQAVEARGQYLESIGALSWLILHRALPPNDTRAHQLVTGADIAPTSWPEAGPAATAPRLAARLAELEASQPP